MVSSNVIPINVSVSSLHTQMLQIRAEQSLIKAKAECSPIMQKNYHLALSDSLLMSSCIILISSLSYSIQPYLIQLRKNKSLY